MKAGAAIRVFPQRPVMTLAGFTLPPKMPRLSLLLGHPLPCDLWQQTSTADEQRRLIPVLLCWCAVRCQRTIFVSRLERSPALSQRRSTRSAHVTGKALCLIHMHVLCVCWPSSFIFRCYFKLWRGFGLSNACTEKTNECTTELG